MGDYLLQQARERERIELDRIVGMCGLSSEVSIKAVNEFHSKWINEQMGVQNDGK